MLVLTRKEGEELTMEVDCDNDKVLIKFVFFGYAKGQAKIGIDAPRCVSVARTELVKAQ